MAAENGDLGKADLNGEAKETQIRSVNVQLMTQQAELERAYNDQTNIMLYLHQTEIAELKDKHAEQLRKRDDHIGSLESQLENIILTINSPSKLRCVRVLRRRAHVLPAVPSLVACLVKRQTLSNSVKGSNPHGEEVYLGD